MSNRYLLSGYEFTDAGPSLILDNVFDVEPSRTYFPIRNKSFTLTSSDETMCIGSYNPKSNLFEMCPNKALPEEGKPTCAHCSRLSGYNPAFYNTEYISTQQSAYNNRPHMAYLVNFGVGQTKIGIAHKLPRRWLDQGARVGTIIKHCKDAYEAREIEANTKSGIGIPEAFNSSTKRRLLGFEFDPKLAENEILEVRDKIQNNLDFQLEMNSVESLDEYYLNNYKITLPIVDLTKNNNFISGNVIGLVGEILILEQNDQQYMMSLKKMISHIVTIDDSIIPNQPIAQTTLGF